MATTRKATAKSPSKKVDNAVHARLPLDVIDKLDKLAEANGISRGAVVAIACSIYVKQATKHLLQEK